MSSPLRVSYRALVAYGVSSIGYFYALNALGALAFPIYNIALGVGAAQLGWALSAPRILDAFFDPVVGWLSDKTRTRWGRRRPYIAVGAVLLGLLAVLLWTPPAHAGVHVIFWYFLAISTLYFFAYSICNIPFLALGFELSTDYNERTRVQAWQSCFGVAAGLTTGWLYRLALSPRFGHNEIEGVRWVGAAVAAAILVTCFAPAAFCRERADLPPSRPAPILESLRLSLSNRPFQILAAIYFLALVTTLIAAPCLLYINIYQVCGSKAYASQVLAWGVTLQTAAAFAGIPCNGFLAKRAGKRTTLIVCLATTAAGVTLFALTLRPDHPYYQLAGNLFFGWGIQGVWLMVASLLPDVCDVDELHTGERREGFFSSAYSVILKSGLAVSALGSGYLIEIAGYRPDVTPAAGVISRLRTMFIGTQLAGLGICIVLAWFYPLTRERMAAIREQLDARGKIGK